MAKFDIGKFAETLAVPESGTLQEIPILDIERNPRNFYPAPKAAELEELMASIWANGLIEPLTVVRADGGKFRLISGHSRLSAIENLIRAHDREGLRRFSLVPCRVLPELTPAQEECAVIEANRQRVKSPALLAQEAKRLTEMYQKRREAGEHLPGRIRNRVAATLNVSPTKIGNVSAIENGLKLPELRDLWALGNIPEDAALEIARLDEDAQRALHWWVTSGKKPWTAKTVREFRQLRSPAPPLDTSSPKPSAASVPEPPAPDWVPIRFADGRETPPRAGEYWCRLDCGGSVIYTNAQWNGVLRRWEFLSGATIDAECLGWYPLPPRAEADDD